MRRLPTALLVLGLLYAAMRATAALAVPFWLYGLQEVERREPRLMELMPGGGALDVGPLWAGAVWGQLVAFSLVAGLLGARRGAGAGWLVLVAWWLVGLLEWAARMAIGAGVGAGQPWTGFFVGAISRDDVCCGLPASLVWFIVLGVTFVWVLVGKVYPNGMPVVGLAPRADAGVPPA